ncbi:hypothetical protein [Bradyrhizobium sp. 23AC]
MRASLVLEPAVLAMPALSNDEQSITRSIERLVEISTFIRNSEFQACLISEAELYLAEANLYPVSDSISTTLMNAGLEHVYSTEDIRRSVQNILQQSQRLENISGVEFLIPSSTTTTPDITSSRERPPIKEALEVTLAHLCLLTEVSSRSVARMISADRNADEEIEVSVDATDITPPWRGKTERSVSCLVGLSSSVRSFVTQLDGDALWQISQNEQELAAAIAIKARSLRRLSGCEAPDANCEAFTIGASLLRMMAVSQCTPDGRYGHATFDCCARLVAKTPLEAPSKLYKLSDSGRRTDVVRGDGAIGWRVHVTKSGEAIRLMFWRKEDSSIEFSTVGPKADVQIH